MGDDRRNSLDVAGDVLASPLPGAGLFNAPLTELPGWLSADLEALDPFHDSDFPGWASWSNTDLSQDPDADAQSLQSSSSVNATPDVAPLPGDLPVGGASTNGKTYQRLPRQAVSILRSWLHRHRQYPYPTKEEKEDLHQQTGLSKAQISHWFSNTRRRKLTGSVSSLQTHPIAISQQSPLERWKNSPPQSEAATTSDIMRALQAMPSSCVDNPTHRLAFDAPQQTWSGSSSSASFIVGAPSVSTFEHSQSSGSELSFNHFPQPPPRPPTPMQMPSRRPRRRRHKPPRATNNPSGRKRDKPRAYQCTFCTDAFRTKYDWARHEKALHLSVDRWPCAPHGGIEHVNGVAVCAFCQAPDPDDDHLNEHDYLTCRDKAPEQRTFHRKDHLRQHLTLSHKVEYHAGMDQWRECHGTLISRCGFCNATFTTWTDRVEHVAEHFKGGSDMVQWRGDWGFDAEIQQLVRNAMPPYLLGHERHTMDPWKSSALWTQEEEEPMSVLVTVDVPNPFNRYTGLHEQLVIYIREEMARGVYPSDQMLQRRARQISYGEDDPWDQTYADYDPMWLAAVKQEAGMYMLHESGALQFDGFHNGGG
ncbi:hypothetical protein BJX76DRAFT_347351 [Aspergillus varians]